MDCMHVEPLYCSSSTRLGKLLKIRHATMIFFDACDSISASPASLTYHVLKGGESKGGSYQEISHGSNGEARATGEITRFPTPVDQPPAEQCPNIKLRGSFHLIFQSVLYDSSQSHIREVPVYQTQHPS